MLPSLLLAVLNFALPPPPKVPAGLPPALFVVASHSFGGVTVPDPTDVVVSEVIRRRSIPPVPLLLLLLPSPTGSSFASEESRDLIEVKEAERGVLGLETEQDEATAKLRGAIAVPAAVEIARRSETSGASFQ